jgi:hypothetical protein
LPNQHNRDEQRANPEKPGDVDNSKENQESQKIEKKTRRKAYISSQVFRWITLTVDVLVFAAVAIYSFFAYQQWQAMNGQLVEMKAATKATRDSVLLARDSARIDQRAWLTLDSIHSDPVIPKKGEPLTIHVIFKNAGKTPAKHAIFHTVVLARETSRGDPDFDADEKSDRDQVIHRALIAPGGVWEMTQTIEADKFDKSAIKDFQDDVARLFVFGRIIYSDIFGCEHWTTFCHRTSFGGYYNTYKTYNDTDDDKCP